MSDPSEYKKMYNAACKNLADLLLQQAETEKNVIRVRKDIQSFSSLCQNNGIEIEPSVEAEYLLRNSLADEIRNILIANYDHFYRPSEMREELKKLGHDLSKYSNPQSAIHMVLKRMAESGEITESTGRDGKSIYRMDHPLRQIVEMPRKIRAALKVGFESKK